MHSRATAQESLPSTLPCAGARAGYEEWLIISLEEVEKLQDSIPRLIAAVLKAKGVQLHIK